MPKNKIERKNGTFYLYGIWLGDNTKVKENGIEEKRPCPVCCECLAHNNPECDLVLHKIEGALFWVCNCPYDEDCGFAYPDEFTEEDIRNLAQERKHYLNSLGIGIMHYKTGTKRG